MDGHTAAARRGTGAAKRGEAGEVSANLSALFLKLERSMPRTAKGIRALSSVGFVWDDNSQATRRIVRGLYLEQG